MPNESDITSGPTGIYGPGHAWVPPPAPAPFKCEFEACHIITWAHKHCLKGHAIDPQNVGKDTEGGCRECRDQEGWIGTWGCTQCGQLKRVITVQGDDGLDQYSVHKCADCIRCEADELIARLQETKL